MGKKEFLNKFERDLAGLTKDKALEGKLMNDALFFWNKNFMPKAIKIVRKLKDYWAKKSEEVN